MSEQHHHTKKEVSDDIPQPQSKQTSKKPQTWMLYRKENFAESELSICPSCAESEPEKNLAAARRAKAVAGNSLPSTSAGIPALTRVMSRQKLAFTLGRYPDVLRYAPSFDQMTKRPLKCPASKCQNFFACNQIINHIFYEHPKIPAEIMNFYQEKIVDVNPNVIVTNEAVILAMLVIPSQIKSASVNQQQDNSFVYLVLGTKQALPSNTSFLVNIWVAGYMAELFCCTIELYAEDRSSSYAYHGDMNALRDSNLTIDIFNRAQCLLLHSRNIDRMTSSETFTIKLKAETGDTGDTGDTGEGKCDLSILIYSENMQEIDDFRTKLAAICVSLRFMSTNMFLKPVHLLDETALRNSSNRYAMAVVKQAPFEIVKEIYLLCAETNIAVQLVLDNT